MFSLMDALLGQPTQEIVVQVALPEEVRVALLGGTNRHRDVYDLVMALETGNWELANNHAAKLQLKESDIPTAYLESVYWAQKVFEL